MSETEFYIRISAEMDVSRAVMQAKRCAERCGFGVEVTTMISTAASELARNIVKYAGSGEIVIRCVDDGLREGLEIEARDQGPGIKDIAIAMQDHVSGSGTLGLGLPGVQRMMDDFRIDSEPGKGTTVVTTKWR
jgi:serine/threonine-protein kinase RsbT